MNPRAVTRRRFLKAAAAAAGAAAAAPYVLTSPALGAPGREPASRRIALGFVGTGDHGVGVNLRGLLGRPDTQVVALCDVDGSRLGAARAIVEQHYGAAARGGGYAGCAATGDWREVVARPDLDALVVSTPDHWHVPVSVAAARAGKDILCEKPLTLTVAEGRLLSDTVARHGRVFRVATEFRGNARLRRACELVRSGRIGRLRAIRVRLPGGRPPPLAAPAPLPPDLDWEMWLGPAPWRPYFQFGRGGQRCHFHWRWIRDYSGGVLTDWGGHLLDSAQWGHGTERTGPVSVEGRGVFAAEGPCNTAWTFQITYEYADGVMLTVASDGADARFEGTGGWVSAGYSAPLQASGPDILSAEPGPGDVVLEGCGEHEDFLACVKARRETQVGAEVGHRTTTLCHIGNIAMLLGRKLRWDPAAERFVGDPEADRLLSRARREPWAL